MKKVLSILVAVAMMLSCMAISVSAMAEDAPEIKVGDTIDITIPKNGSDENHVNLAKFVPAETGWYTFTCDKEYVNAKGADNDLPGGVFALDLQEENGMSTQGMCFFMDVVNMSEEVKKQFEELGMDMAHASTLKVAAYAEAGKTYYVTAYQDGAEDYTAALTVEKHTHTIKKIEKKNDESEPDGIYEDCEDWYCNYYELVEPYFVNYEVTEGANQTIEKGKDLKFTANGPFEKFRELKVDGEELTDDEFATEEGSTKVTLKADYLKTLKAGKHEVKVIYNDGEATTDFTLVEAEKKAATGSTSTTVKDTSVKSPATGANGALALAMAAMTAGLGMAFVVKKKEA